MSIKTAEIQEGDVISYEDCANPLREYIVIHLPQPGDPNQDYGLLRVVPGEIIFSDCRQNGWNLVKRRHG